MAFSLYSNGVRLQWDENLTIGSLITTYNEGFHVLTRIDFRDPPDDEGSSFNARLIQWSHDDMKIPPLFHYVKVLKSNGQKSKAISGRCCASFCKQVTVESRGNEYLEELTSVKAKHDAVMSYLI